MPGWFHQQQHGDHPPRILGWDVAGRLAPIIVADSRYLVAIFGLEPPGVPFTVSVGPGGERTSYHRSDPTTFFVGAQGLWSAGLTAAMVDGPVAAAGHGREGGMTHGTARTWALAVALHPALGPLLRGIAGGWWNHGAVDISRPTVRTLTTRMPSAAVYSSWATCTTALASPGQPLCRLGVPHWRRRLRR
jgi:hypothetical protein